MLGDIILLDTLMALLPTLAGFRDFRFPYRQILVLHIPLAVYSGKIDWVTYDLLELRTWALGRARSSRRQVVRLTCCFTSALEGHTRDDDDNCGLVESPEW